MQFTTGAAGLQRNPYLNPFVLATLIPPALHRHTGRHCRCRAAQDPISDIIRAAAPYNAAGGRHRRLP